jgi:pimeloyl-ACP methyl ester carboxylesterase
VLDPAVSFFPGRDGVDLVYREMGVGRPLVLLHGLAGDATLWLRHGQAETFAALGHRVIMPDFRQRTYGPGSATRTPRCMSCGTFAQAIEVGYAAALPDVRDDNLDNEIRSMARLAPTGAFDGC